MMSNAAPDIATFEVLSVPVSVVTPETALEYLQLWAQDKQGRFVCVRDVHGIMRAQDNKLLMQAHRQAAMVTPDGMPIAIIGKRRGLPVERTTGPDLMLRALIETKLRHYFYGAGEGVAQALVTRMSKRNPQLKVAGVETPPYGDIENSEIEALAQRINMAACDVVWIGLSTPKQELLMQRLAPLAQSTLIGVGAAFDIHAGLLKRPPIWVQKASLEGVYRLMMEPRRLWYRYLVLAPKFLWRVVTERPSNNGTDQA